MASPYSIKNSLGVDLNEVVTAVEIASGKNKSKHRLGTVVDASNGRAYVYAQANATIAANTAVASISPTTFLATATAGTYLSPAVGLVAGDYAWFSKANV
jgi:hypothetical protein